MFTSSVVITGNSSCTSQKTDEKQSFETTDFIDSQLETKVPELTYLQINATFTQMNQTLQSKNIDIYSSSKMLHKRKSNRRCEIHYKL